MQLLEAESVSQEKLRFFVRSVKAVSLFYVCRGRNAWHGTWITRYDPSCMHTSMYTACGHAEDRRVQGTVFYIVELPSIAILGAQGALVISEINTERFFSRFSLKRFSSLAALIPISTMTLRQFMHIFDSRSTLWAAGYPPRNSAILSYVSDAERLVELDGTRKLRSWTSSSRGKSYLLHWSERPFKGHRKSLHSLVEVLNREIQRNP